MYLVLRGTPRRPLQVGDLRAAPATPLVLTILRDGASSGYSIVQRVRERSGGELEWADGVVYPLFHRLRRLGYLTSEWRTAEQGPRRRYYRITDVGRVIGDRVDAGR